MDNPRRLICVRHGQSTANVMRDEIIRDPEYRRFIRWYEEDPQSSRIIALAQELKRKYAYKVPDYNIPLTRQGAGQAIETARRLSNYAMRHIPAAVFISPYLRTRETFMQMKIGYPELANVKDVFYEYDLCEQSLGAVATCGDFKIFTTLNPEQRELQQREGEYSHRFPYGENIPDLRFRVRSFLERMRKEYNNRDVLIVAHYITLLALRAEIEHWSAEEFLEWQVHTNLINCAVSVYFKLDAPYGSGALRNVMFNRRFY